jgi:hypothetical protein
MFINGIQVDIQSAIVISMHKQPVSLHYMYFVRATPGVDEYGADNSPASPCYNSPCENGGFCVVVSNMTYNCLCTTGWTGEQYFSILNEIRRLNNLLRKQLQSI